MIVEAGPSMVPLTVQRAPGAMIAEAMGLKVSQGYANTALDRRVRWPMEILLCMFVG